MLANLVEETANNPGAGVDISLLGPPANRLGFAQAFGNGAAVFYIITDGAQTEWGVSTVQVGSPNKLSGRAVIGNTARTTARLNFTGACRVFCELPAERVPYLGADGKVAAAFMPAKTVAWNGSWSGTFDMGTAPTELIAIGVPNGVRAIVGGFSARGENQASSLATVAVDVVLRTPGGALVQQFPDAAAVAGNNLPRYWQIGGPFSFSIAADIGFQNLTLGLRARKDLAIGPYNVNQIVAGLVWIY